jgi:N-formylglutamate amidohydrolase
MKSASTLDKLEHYFAKVSPILIRPRTTSITVSLSQRFFLFQLMRKVIYVIENDPYMNFLSLLKGYKVLGNFLSGTIHEFHRDRNEFYYKNFFVDHELYKVVKADMNRLVKTHPEMRVTITKYGTLVYDNYKKNQFNVLLMTMHGGTWLPKNLKKKIGLTKRQTIQEEDIGTSEIYGLIVLEKGGIWIDNKQSRFGCDYNRSMLRCIYTEKSEQWLPSKKMWKEELTKEETAQIHECYKEFYFLLEKLVDAYRFNIIFDGHSMNPLEGRPDLSFGTEHIPRFYLPIVKSMKRKLNQLGYTSVKFNTPYGGGHILHWMSTKFQDVFIFSMEINKGLYLNKANDKINSHKAKKLARNLVQIFVISEEEESE